MCFVKILTTTFFVVLPEKIDNPVPASQVRFQRFGVIEAFASMAETSAVIVGRSNNDLEFLLIVLLKATISSFSALRKLINAFPLFPRSSDRRVLLCDEVKIKRNESRR